MTVLETAQQLRISSVLGPSRVLKRHAVYSSIVYLLYTPWPSILGVDQTCMCPLGTSPSRPLPHPRRWLTSPHRPAQTAAARKRPIWAETVPVHQLEDGYRGYTLTCPNGLTDPGVPEQCKGHQRCPFPLFCLISHGSSADS